MDLSIFCKRYVDLPIGNETEIPKDTERKKIQKRLLDNTIYLENIFTAFMNNLGLVNRKNDLE